MYAVVDIKGFQFKLEKGDTLRVPKFDLEVGKKVKLSDVLLIADEGSYAIGQPFVEGAVVEATVTGQGKYDKIVVFKKKRRKDYSVKKGHRQDFTEISVDGIKISRKKTKKADEEVSAQPEAAEIKPETIDASTETVDATAETVETDKKAKKALKKKRTPRKKKEVSESSPAEQDAPETDQA